MVIMGVVATPCQYQTLMLSDSIDSRNTLCSYALTRVWRNYDQKSLFIILVQLRNHGI